MVTFVCVCVNANVPYGMEYVQKLYKMVKRHYAGPFRFVCFTDDLSKCLGLEFRKIKPRVGLAGWWSKLEIFNPEHELTGRVVYLDLDVLVVGDLSDVAQYPAPLAFVPDGGNFQGRGNLRVVKKYNSSVITWDDRARPKLEKVYRAWSPKVAKRLWGDQDFLAEMLPHEETMPPEWFPRLSEWVSLIERDHHLYAVDARRALSEIPKARVVLSKKPKNAEARDQWPWFKELWG